MKHAKGIDVKNGKLDGKVVVATGVEGTVLLKQKIDIPVNNAGIYPS